MAEIKITGRKTELNLWAFALRPILICDHPVAAVYLFLTENGWKMIQTSQPTVIWKIITCGFLPPRSYTPVWLNIQFIVP